MAQPSDSASHAPLPAGVRIAALTSSYHGDLVGRMCDSALQTLIAAGLRHEDWTRIEAPGAYELPILAAELARSGEVDAVLCFGLVLRGETDHDRYICGAVATRLLDIGLETGVPILFGVLTPNTLAQAEARAKTRAEGGLDKGAEVANAAVGALHALVRCRAPFGSPAPESRTPQA